MNQLKKIERRLAKLYRLQKQLEKKKRKLTRKFGDKRKKNKAFGLVSSRKPTPVVSESVLPKAVFGIVVGTLCGVVATLLINAWKNNKAANEALASASTEGVDMAALAPQESHAEYDKASLEELEEALLRVENELDEVSAAIERSKK